MAMRKKPTKKRVRCPYRKGEVIIHRSLGELEVVSTRKVGPKSWQLVCRAPGIAVTVPVDGNIRKAA